MANIEIQQHSLVLYKNQPALVRRIGEKLDLTLKNGKTIKVRTKDVQLLHPGPVQNLAAMEHRALALTGEMETAWELLAGETTTLADLADLIYSDFSPETAWATWQHVAQGLHFQGSPEAIIVQSVEAVAQAQAAREAKMHARQSWAAFLSRLRENRYVADDAVHLEEVAAVAYGKRDSSRVLTALGQIESPENAQALLLKLGYWDHRQNPHPSRLGLPEASSSAPVVGLGTEDRVDLTHLPTFAIDDIGSTDPDDALSIDENRLWVHIADVATVVQPDSPADLEARARGANLYLPEGTITMLPEVATQTLGLGLNNPSPALSIGLDLDASCLVLNVEIVPSWIQVQRLTYAAAEAQLMDDPLQRLYQIAQTTMARRQANGAVEIDLPEVKVQVNEEGQVDIRSLPALRSRDLVREAMLLCGEAVARFAQHQAIPFPYSVQAQPDDYDASLLGLAGMFARRRAMKPSQRLSEPGPHAGLGLPVYTQATSPLRRYADLVAHQQLRAHLAGKPLLSLPSVLARIAEAEAMSGSVRQAERLSRKHWTLVYLQQHPDWQGEAVLVEIRHRRGLFLIPTLDFEGWLSLPKDVQLNETILLHLQGIDLARLEAYFRAF